MRLEQGWEGDKTKAGNQVGDKTSTAWDDLKQDATESVGHPNSHPSVSFSFLSILDNFASTVFYIEPLEMRNIACQRRKTPNGSQMNLMNKFFGYSITEQI